MFRTQLGSRANPTQPPSLRAPQTSTCSQPVHHQSSIYRARSLSVNRNRNSVQRPRRSLEGWEFLSSAQRDCSAVTHVRSQCSSRKQAKAFKRDGASAPIMVLSLFLAGSARAQCERIVLQPRELLRQENIQTCRRRGGKALRLRCLVSPLLLPMRLNQETPCARPHRLGLGFWGAGFFSLRNSLQRYSSLRAQCPPVHTRGKQVLQMPGGGGRHWHPQPTNKRLKTAWVVQRPRRRPGQVITTIRLMMQIKFVVSVPCVSKRL
mmetsp:Transcript_4374/g.12644  ORF Transcript_4374/g.12644 Transcript_4374/m.12644 type:complete len:264 (-) Transcript_4374:1029-1820(-)